MFDDDVPVVLPTFHYGQNVMYDGHEYAIREMCTHHRNGVWYHKIIRGVPVGRCTDGTGLEVRLVADTQLSEVTQ